MNHDNENSLTDAPASCCVPPAQPTNKEPEVKITPPMPGAREQTGRRMQFTPGSCS